MNAAEEIEVNATEHLKFYSQGAIAMATFFGGPLAAGILIRENYKKFNDAKNGNRALIIGIISTILLFGFIFLIPESIIEKIPSPVIPAVYTRVSA